ncbi:UDP-N-acetylglucosamine 2-epimerase [Chryseotalea sanaruensis]|uniref:UDP-N-acetylglucosamine 2-epimerase n=1 Tax=Chryseotalea sanaruensis TaxID=2482724 RepID=A0A401UC52_9BACT|nr:UDP-N-acetylglucosamine 2-epimerase (non-hydrolyzing) [Chryseotalea sanaruensis]GCC52459.1 UDP-N-acetylglucosamine 2-epimerase [Chryseotalea sanaruensis]
MKKIVTILGARPQFIKAATLSRVFHERDLKEVIIHTGQHYDWNMSDIFFEQMAIPKPNYALSINSKHHGDMTGKMLEGIEKVLLDEKPNAVLVYGDTNSTLAGALAAAKLHIPIAHVEAGLRSFNRRMPEEINRVLTDHMSTWLFAPTTTAVNNLSKEGITQESILQVGDVMYDAVLFYQKMAQQQSDVLKRIGINSEPFILATIHRAENTNSQEKLRAIFSQLEILAKEKLVILPLHPRTKSLLDRDYSTDQFKIIDPIGYFDMILLQKHCKLIITDSGGVQKEAFFNNKFCITVREETEWVELVEHGFNFLANPISTIQTLVTQLWDREFDSKKNNLYGIGKSAEKIVDILEKNI